MNGIDRMLGGDACAEGSNHRNLAEGRRAEGHRLAGKNWRNQRQGTSADRGINGTWESEQAGDKM